MKLRELFKCCNTLAHLDTGNEIRIENPNSKYYFTGYTIRIYDTRFIEWRMYKVDAKGKTTALLRSFTDPEDLKNMRRQVKLESGGWRLEPITAKVLKITFNEIQTVLQKIEEDKE